MAIWKVKSQTAVTVEFLGRLPQSDCDRMNEELQADPPAKTVHGQRAREGSPSRLQVSTQMYSESPQSLPSSGSINLDSLLESLAQPPNEASIEVTT